MAKMRGESSFQTEAGDEYKIVLDLYAFAEAEDVTGLGPNELMAAMTPVLDAKGKVVKSPPLKVIGGLLYGGLKTAHPDMTHADAIRLLGEGEVVGEAIAAAMSAIMPKSHPSAEGKVQPSLGTGTKPRKRGQPKA